MMASETPLSDVRFLTVAEVATIMRVSKMTVYRLVHSGELEAIRVGRSFRVPEQAVNQYLRAAFVGTASRAGAGGCARVTGTARSARICVTPGPLPSRGRPPRVGGRPPRNVGGR